MDSSADLRRRFRRAFGEGEAYRACGPAEQSRLAPVVPDFLLDLWASDGWSGYRAGLLWTVDPQDFEPVVDAWKLPGRRPIAIARTAFGSLYLLREFAMQAGARGFAILELDPHTGNYTVVGPSARHFWYEGITQPPYIKTVVREADAQRAARDRGPLAWDEMYGYEPALALSGSRTPENVRRFNIFDHHRLLSQLTEVNVVKL